MAENKRISLYLIIPVILQTALIYYLVRINQSLLSILLNIGVYLAFAMGFYLNGHAEKAEFFHNELKPFNKKPEIVREWWKFLFKELFSIFVVVFSIYVLFKISVMWSVILGWSSSGGIYRTLKGGLPDTDRTTEKIRVSDWPKDVKKMWLLFYVTLGIVSFIVLFVVFVFY